MRMPQCRHRRVRVNSRPPAVARPDSVVNPRRAPADLLGDFPTTSATCQVVRPLPPPPTMRTASLAALATAGAFASLLAVPAVAHAQPSLVEPVASPSGAPAADAYLEPGLEVGLSRGGFYGALQLDGGHRLGDGALWLHGRLAQGSMAGIDERTMASDFTEARVGLEARSCGLHGVLCLFTGLDAGYRHERLLAEYDNTRADLAAAIPRLGFDLGGTRLRLRASIETALDQRGWDGLGLTTGVACAW